MAWQQLDPNHQKLSQENDASPFAWLKAIRYFQKNNELRLFAHEIIMEFLASSLIPLTHNRHSSLEKDPQLEQDYLKLVFDIFCDRFIVAKNTH